MKKILLSLLALVAVSFVSRADDTYVVAGNLASIFGTSWDASNTDNLMSLQGDGTYAKGYYVSEAVKDIQFKVVKNGSEWIGDENGNNVSFNMKGAGDFTISIDPNTNAISVTGANVAFADKLEYETVFAVGNGSGAWLCGATWEPGYIANEMGEIAPDVWEILYLDVPAANNLQLKFALDGTWANNFGGTFAGDAVETPAVYDGGNITFDHPGGNIRLHLDLSKFNLKTKQGATFAIYLGESAIPSNFEVLDPVVQMGTYIKFEARNTKNNYKYVLDSFEWPSDRGPQLQLTISRLDDSLPAAFTMEDLADINYWEPLFEQYTLMFTGEAMHAYDNIKKLYINDVAIWTNQFRNYPYALNYLEINSSGDYVVPIGCFSTKDDHFAISSFECKVEGDVTIGDDVFPAANSGKMTIYCYKEDVAKAWYNYKIANQQAYTVFLNGEKYEGNGVELTGADAAQGTGIRYNVMGQRVNENYKGVVIMDGKKLIVR